MQTGKERVLVVDDNRLIVKLIEDRLKEAGFSVLSAGSAEEAQGIIQAQGVPDLIVLDVMMPGMDGFDYCRQLKKDPTTAGVPVLMLTARSEIKEKIRGFEAGADDYVVKPFETPELVLRIKALLSRSKGSRCQPEARPHHGKIISVFSLRGGVGRSTLAVNLAASLSGLWGVEVALVDLALESDQAAMMLNLRPKLTWAGLTEATPEEVDEDLLLGHLASHEGGVQLLAAPHSPVLASLVTQKLVHRVLTLLGTRYEYVVLDMAPTFGEQNLAALDLSDLIVMMVTPELAGLKAARVALEIFESLGYGHERLAVVLNLLAPKGALSQKNIETALGLPIQMTLPYEPTAVMNGINTGRPLVLDQPKLRISMEIQKFGYQLSSKDMQERGEFPTTEMRERVLATKSR